MANLFAYGTLMCDDIMESVAGCMPNKNAAALYGYRRLEVKREQYPGLVAGGKENVAGVLYYDVPVESWKRLDSFEGEMYSRLEVTVELEDGSTREAYTYIVKKEYENRLECRSWSLERFLEKGKDAFETNYTGYEEIR